MVNSALSELLLNIDLSIGVHDDILVKIREFAQSVVGNIKGKLFFRSSPEYVAHSVHGFAAGVGVLAVFELENITWTAFGVDGHQIGAASFEVQGGLF